MSAHPSAGEAGGQEPGDEQPAGAQSPPEVEQPPAEGEPAPLVIRKRGRRVSTEPPAGYTGEPAIERQQSSENDARLKGDVPPHWG